MSHHALKYGEGEDWSIALLSRIYTLVKSVEFYYTLPSTLVWSYHSSTEVWSLSIKKCGVFLFHTRCAP